MANFTKILKDVAKLYDGKVTGNVVKFDSEDTLFKVADEIADQAPYTMDQDKLTIEFIDENIDVQFIGQVCNNINESFDKQTVSKVMKSFGFINESTIDSVSDQLSRLTSTKKNVSVEPDAMQGMAQTVTVDTVQSTTIGADGTITLRVGDKLMNVNPIQTVDINESMFAYFGTTQLNESEYNAVLALNGPESRKRFLASMGMNDLDAESVAENLALLKKNYPEMDDNGLLPIPGAVNESTIEDKFDFHNIAFEKMVQAGKVTDLKAHLNSKGSGVAIDNDFFDKKYSDIPAEMQKEVGNFLKDQGFISESEYVNESKNMDIYNLQSKIALAIHKSGLKGSDVLSALLLVTAEAKDKNNFKTYINISDNKYINESDEVPVLGISDIADFILNLNDFGDVTKISRNKIKSALKKIIETYQVFEDYLEADKLTKLIDEIESKLGTEINESIQSIEHKISNEKERIQKIKAQGKADQNMNDTKLANAKRTLSYSKSELKSAKKSKEINESLMINESAVAYIVPSYAYTNPWLSHYINRNPLIVDNHFSNIYHDYGINAMVPVVDDTCADCDQSEPRLVYRHEDQLHYASPIGTDIAPYGRLDSVDVFKLYADRVLTNLGMSNTVDRSENIEKIIERNQNNYGAMIHALHQK